MRNKNGITLIALIVTIIVLLILAGIVVVTLFSDNGVVNKSLKAAFYDELSQITENIKLELTNNAAGVYLGETEKVIFTQDLKVNTSEMPSTLLNEQEALGGKEEDLYWVPKNLGNDREKTYVYDTKIKVVFKVNGLKLGKKMIHSIYGADVDTKESKTAKMDVSTEYGYYEPDLNGFDLENTYIVYYSSDCSDYYADMKLKDYITAGKPKTYKLIKDGNEVTYYFHDYKSATSQSIWGNVITRANGLESWWVWIPRYAYIPNSTGKDLEVVFTDVNNNSLNSEKTFTGNNMGEYIAHSGFKVEETELKGLWMAKYEASISENGDDKIDGSQKYYKPKITGYNINSTYIATYNQDGNESGNQYLLKDVLSAGYKANTDGSLISGTVDESKFGDGECWYNYSNKIWGNIVTKANGLESWWVWIPRYAYMLSKTDTTTDVVFITTSNRLFNGGRELGLYTPHPAFTLKDGTELEGIWMAKYEASIAENGNDIQDDGNLRYYKPNLKGFNIESTSIVTYNEDGAETGNKYLLKDILKSGYQADGNVLISGEVDESKFGAGEYWYNYSKKIWGNIVTNANNLEAWWVWIPRYAYMLSKTDTTTDVVFITTEDKLFNGQSDLGFYTPHPAFNLKDGTKLEGIWMAKYEASGTFETGDEEIK